MSEHDPSIELRITQPDVLKALASIDKLVELRTHREVFSPFMRNVVLLDIEVASDPDLVNKILRSGDDS